MWSGGGLVPYQDPPPWSVEGGSGNETKTETADQFTGTCTLGLVGVFAS